ncbi:acyl-CoA dehydrogenase family protein [Azospirillum sp. ST 5-10]|uniref:acyl-CoA dehydrogenase family protein n=1 Tax=unclassified Azospirillum TaxID=2630922 RepID=UPI003F4A24A7
MSAAIMTHDDDRLIADSANAFLAGAGGLDRVRRLRDAGGGLDRATWTAMAELGWFAMLVPEDAGGLGLTPRDAVTLMEAVGRHLPVEPVAGALAAAAAIAAARPEAAALEAAMAGRLVVVPVAAPAVRRVDGAWTGASDHAADLAAADAFLVAAHSALLLLPADAAGLRVEALPGVDGGSVGRLHLDGVTAAEELAVGDAASAAATLATDMLRLAHAAYLVGLADTALAATVAFMTERRQFGVPIASFQALQHRAASLAVAVRSARALVQEAARPADRTAACAAAKLVAGETAFAVAKECIQFHGAIGFTDEHTIGLFLKRAMALCGAAGSADDCLRAVAAA